MSYIVPIKKSVDKFFSNREVHFSCARYFVSSLGLFLGALSFVVSGGISVAHAATLRIDASPATVSVGETATLSVSVNSEGVAINNAEATITFPTDIFDILSISKGGSVFSLWVEDPGFSNGAGTITFNGGVPTPGFNGAQGSVVSIVARAKKTGEAAFTFTDAAVRANDGLGTDVLSGKQGKVVTVTKKEAVVPSAAPAVGPAMQIVSSTHPNQDKWYTDSSPVFTWDIPSGADAIQTSMDTSPSSSKLTTASSLISKRVFDGLKDGVWYFKARARTAGTWGATRTYIARIDATPPVKKDVVFTYDDRGKKLTVDADIQDITSGIDRYEITVNGALIKTVPASDFVSGRYTFNLDAVGNNEVLLRAIDRAGNSVEAKGNFSVAELIPPKLDAIPTTVAADEQLIVRGTTEYPNTDLSVYLRYGEETPSELKTKAGSDGTFFVLTPKLKAGTNINIWAEIANGSSKASSERVLVTVAKDSLIVIGPFERNAFIVGVAAGVAVIMLLMVGAYFVGRRSMRARAHHGGHKSGKV